MGRIHHFHQMYFGATTLVVVICCLLQRNVAQKPLKCKLNLNDGNSWPDIKQIDGFPANTINLGGMKTDTYIVTRNFGEGFVIGNYHTKYNAAYFNKPDPKQYKVLVNQENCTVAWVSALSVNPPEFAAKAYNTSYYVGRIYEDGIYHGGELTYYSGTPPIPPTFKVTVFNESKSYVANAGVQVLTSFSEGFTKTLENVDIPIEPDTDDANAMAVEEIRNNGDAVISQTVEHKKTIKEVFRNTIYETLRSEYVHSCHWRFRFLWFRFGYYSETRSYNEAKKETWTTEKTTEISLQRTITVPPNEGVQVCSIVSIKDNIVHNYTGQMVYRAPGMTPADLYDILKADSPAVEFKDGRVFQNISGTFSGSLAMSSAFFVVDLNKGIGCIEYAQGIVKTNAKRWRSLKYELQNNRTISNPPM
ncbi:unnamed protein product [Allacma fusca]|uniref:Uncharacterized protein n=1 Tax=Allacma fusca TaxID=39272 RepID=A0A8J2P3I6_9HEXA|nr:unnamed protein product [Allacma fusca]